MPLYEYECDACGHRFEVIQKFSDPPLEKCPKCGSTVHKLQSAPAFHLKGTGWYATDYAKKDQATPAGKSETSAKDSKDNAAETKDAAAKTEKTSGTSDSTSSTPAPATSSKDKPA